MQYLERTLQVKAALFGRSDLLEKIRAIFASHIAKDEAHEPIGRGNSRFAYEVAECEVAPGIKINLLLKLKKEPSRLKYSQAAKRSQFSDWSEFGAFEVYYDFIAGHIATISFRSKAGYERYRAVSAFGSRVKHTFSLAEDWGGTKVEQGDMGAIPYFQLVIRHRGWFGQLTEGEPPFIEPKYTAEDRGTMDDYTVEGGRIIDIGPTQCLLIDIDRGGHLRFDERYPNNLGVRLRGEKYFHPQHRLDI
ncbi:hypothetical protein A3C94_02710 [Candidatus Kaiserbacteria bacterium RIFCSPHIGHO2_02_FULL_55_17]|uniref:Uncharacterized protein n=1 Tax=Candidatus Kaiserbacteria bacterium RIFCSPHIGHO2_02_FULL_55_17 TaxID=1798496 RepID=A0A1F6DSV9_9BACT|nr:MAG: hypothetical protein A3C94_02710 [Candidatus Kaiserbacteria bacterium RIFCSPHIGHO2_02_FULL_55_17]